ncbi:hypothetical protein BO99DRAFT_74570 [Aspergillus violaceofuscus CBS 115571]|uniref:Uncharacterized protein n=1 Tax=Aspergillus violaceofuscus (strain CBS 115571) TaxID=1450538 RepID=A0A2V5HAC3_ASPV1|nr:hypothetical protein BO99DRAFT_74570 [Aspergillus violaceofuscus CBS 115571]
METFFLSVCGAVCFHPFPLTSRFSNHCRIMEFQKTKISVANLKAHVFPAHSPSPSVAFSSASILYLPSNFTNLNSPHEVDVHFDASGIWYLRTMHSTGSSTE